jgi:hypothetical protein
MQSLVLRMNASSTPSWERVALMEDFLKDVKDSRAELRLRWRNMTQERRTNLNRLYRQTLKGLFADNEEGKAGERRRQLTKPKNPFKREGKRW